MVCVIGAISDPEKKEGSLIHIVQGSKKNLIYLMKKSYDESPVTKEIMEASISIHSLMEDENPLKNLFADLIKKDSTSHGESFSEMIKRMAKNAHFPNSPF